ncbi:MAG: DALR domain-containing protein [Candidatus Limnocylindrales bacterium]
MLRYALLAVHYRAPIEFSDESLVAAAGAVDRLSAALASLEAYQRGSGRRRVAGLAAGRCPAAFAAAMDDDLNASAALAALFDLDEGAESPRRRPSPLDRRRGAGGCCHPRPRSRAGRRRRR